MLDVLPLALVSAATAVRSVAREIVPPVHPEQLADPVLTDALADFSSRWSHASVELRDAADGCADSLQRSAEEYVKVDSLLVPRALR